MLYSNSTTWLTNLEDEEEWDGSAHKYMMPVPFAPKSRQARVSRDWLWLKDTALADRPAQTQRSRQIFDELADRWLEDTEFLSNLTRIHMHPAYQRIIGMGPVALPLIISRLHEANGHWFWALACISGEDPASGTETMGEARINWLAWAREHGYVATEH